MTRNGNTIIEALLAVGIATVVVATVGNLIVSVNRVDRTSAHKDQASSYAREALEITAAIADDEFDATGGCTPVSGYTTCWSGCPPALSTCTASDHFIISGNTFVVQTHESIGSNPEFRRWLTFEEVGGDPNVVLTTATVEWTERNQPKQVSQQTIVSNWKD